MENDLFEIPAGHGRAFGSEIIKCTIFQMSAVKIPFVWKKALALAKWSFFRSVTFLTLTHIGNLSEETISGCKWFYPSALWDLK
jgi:hypothetical protein